MASKKSPSPTATRSPPATSPATTQSPLASDPYKYRRHSFMKTEATTLPPTTTSTPVPTADPYEYEKSALATRTALTDRELEQLKDHIRMLHGMPVTHEKQWRRFSELRPPKWRPRATLTSWRRAQLQQHRLLVRCGGNLKAKYEDYRRQMGDSEDSEHIYRRMRDDAMAQNSDQLEAAAELEELRQLRYLAERAKMHEVAEYRDNEGSRLRFKSVRGEPIISSNFRDAYDDHMKPPFSMTRYVRQPRSYQRPKIDKRKEIWLMPVEDDDGRPLHSQPRTPPPKQKRSRPKKGERAARKKGAARQKGTPKTQERRSSKKSAEKGKGSPKTNSKVKERVIRKKPPWHVAQACPPNTGWYG